MYLKKQFFVVLNLVFVLTLDTCVWAATETQQPNEKSTSQNTEAVEATEKAEEPISFFSVKSFMKSDFVRSSVWPGIGPFDSVAPTESESSGAGQTIKLTDPSHNVISCATTANEINTCELELHNSISDSQGLLNLQISTDFLLEGLGVKPKQIHIVNQELSKKSNLLTGNNYNPVSVIIAPLTISFQNIGKKEGTNSPLFRVAVLNQSGNKEKSASSESATNTEETKPAEIDAASLPSMSDNKSEAENGEPQSKNGSANRDRNFIASQSTEEANTKVTASGATTNKTSQSKPLSANEALKKQFLDLIIDWQRIKKTAVRQRQTNELSQALSGKALVRQTDAIKWLASNHKYYEMLAQGAVIERFEPIVQGKKYAVFAEVKEKTKFVEDSTNKSLKQSDDTYKVNYTVEKIGSHWLISDFALIKPGTTPATNPSANKSKH